MMRSRRRVWSRALRLPLHLRAAERRLLALHAERPGLPELTAASLDLGTRGLVKIKASQLHSEILELAREIAALRPRVILEIGTDRGGTLLIWAQLASDLVITCDLAQPWYRRRLYERFVPPDSSCRVLAWAGDSQAPEMRQRVKNELAGRRVDALFIDGDHREEGVAADYENYRDLVRPGGIIAFHDVVENQPFSENQVYRLWRGLRDRPGTREIVEDPHQCGFGIGILRVEGS